MAAPWNTSITIPAVQITQFHRRGRRPSYHRQPPSAALYNVQNLQYILHSPRTVNFCAEYVFSLKTLLSLRNAQCTLYNVDCVQGSEHSLSSANAQWALPWHSSVGAPFHAQLCKVHDLSTVCKSAKLCIVGLWARRALQSLAGSLPSHNSPLLWLRRRGIVKTNGRP